MRGLTRVMQRRPVLVITLACVVLGGLQLWVPEVPASDALYVGVLLLAMLSGRPPLVVATSAVGMVTTLLHASSALEQAPPAIVAINTAIVLASLSLTTLLALAFLRRAQRENAALDDAQALRRESAQHKLLLQRLSMSAEAAELWVWEADAQGSALWDMNRPRGLGLEGLPCAEVFSVFNRLVDPDDMREIDARIRRDSLGGAEPIQYRYRIRSPNGMLRHFQLQARVVKDEEGRTLRLLGITRDITNEVQTMEMLQRQAEQERSLLERLSIAAKSAGLHCWQYDPRTRQFLWSENAVVELGCDGSSLTLEELRDFALTTVHPDDAETVSMAIRSSFAEGTDLAVRFRRIRRDGSIAHFQMHGRVIRDVHGRPIHTIGATMDVTDAFATAARLQQQTEQLREFQRRLERAALFSQEGHWEAELVTNKHWVSESYRALLGYDLEFDLSTAECFFRLVHPDHEEELRQLVQRCIESRQLIEYNLRLKHANGEWRWIHVRGNVERDDGGAPVRISGSIRDVHQQVIMQNELHEAHERFARAIRGTQDGLWESEEAHTGQLWLAPRLAEILEFAADEIADWNWSTLTQRMHPDDVQQVLAARERTESLGENIDIEHRIQTKSGRWIWVRIRATPEFDAAGQVCRVSGSMQDVTEQHRARAELIKATEDAQAASLAKSDFLANVSHEIRTPMNGIIGMTGLLLETPLDRTQREYAETVRSSADALLTVINDILDFSKIEAGKLDVEAIEMDLRGNVEDVGSMLGFQAAAKHLELIVNVHHEVPERVIGDPQRIRQCLINLVGNAIKFTHAGEIAIEVGTIGRRDGKVLVSFEVRDTGIGIDAHTLRTLFQPFVQADSSTTRRFGGTGLGLSIVKRLTELMGGQVGVASEPGKGSTFCFTLPFEPVASSPPAPHANSLPVTGRRVLVVDDNATNRRMLSNQLARVGYDVEQAESGPAALAAMYRAVDDQRPFEAVLVDCLMPEMDGATLGETINTDPLLARARVVMLTSVDRHDDVRRLSALGFAAYLTKPVRARELLRCLEKVLSRDSTEWHMQTQPLVTRASLNEEGAGSRRGGTVLLVEDNAVNQKVAHRFLERLKCTVVTANDGAEAVEAFKRGRFDLVLMDLQMPVMDGLTATSHIRELESGRPRTPIVALTANAMSVQMERCLAAGMNDFLTKPIDIERLQDIVARYCEHPRAPEAGEDERLSSQLLESATSAACAYEAIIDTAQFEALTEGDAQFACELVHAYAASARETFADIQRWLARNERAQIARCAHRLKGASANVHVPRTYTLCTMLETEAETLSSSVLEALVAELGMCIQSTLAELEQLLRNKPAA